MCQLKNAREQYMTETEIQQILFLYFRGEGYEPWCPPHINRNGPDLVAYHRDLHHLWIIEAKSDVNPSPSDRTGSTGRRMSFEGALAQICQRRPDEWKQKCINRPLLPADIVTYGLAFPEGEGYRSLCRTIRTGIRPALSLYLFFMQPDVPPVIIGPMSRAFDIAGEGLEY